MLTISSLQRQGDLGPAKGQILTKAFMDNGYDVSPLPGNYIENPMQVSRCVGNVHLHHYQASCLEETSLNQLGNEVCINIAPTEDDGSWHRIQVFAAV